MGYLRSDEERRLQLSLIPVNIIVCLLCIAAMIFLLFVPWARVNCSVLISALSASETENEKTPPSEEETPPIEVETPPVEVETPPVEMSALAGDDFFDKDAVLNALKETDAKLTLGLVDFGKATFAKGNKVEGLVSALFGNRLWEDILIPAFSFTAASLVPNGSNAILEKANKALTEIGSAGSEEKFVEKTDAWLQSVEEATGKPLAQNDREWVQSEMLETYRATKEATNDEFDLEKFVCTAMSRSMKFDAPVTDYEALTAKFLASGSLGGTLDKYSTIVGKYMMYVFFALVAFVLVWFVLFLFAFVRMFVRNKRFMTWYVLLLGGLPAAIFWLLPKLLGILAVGVRFAGFLAAYSSYTWISGICYVLLWLISLCWAFPIKRKIRKIRKIRKRGY